MVTAEGAKLLLVAAEPGELRGILRRSKAVRKLRWPVWFARTGELNGQRLIVVANGPGPELAASGIRAALDRSRPDVIRIAPHGLKKPTRDESEETESRHE